MPNDDDLADLAEIDDVPPTKQLAAIAIALLFALLAGGMLSGCTTSDDIQKRPITVEELAAGLEAFDQTPVELGCHYSPAKPQPNAVRCYEIGR